MSILAVNSFIPATGGTSFGIEGVAKAYWNYNQGSPVVNDSYNLSSITDNATGFFTPNFTNSFSNSSHASNCTAFETNFNSTNYIVGCDYNGQTTSDVDVRFRETAGTAFDGSSVGTTHGVLA